MNPMRMDLRVLSTVALIAMASCTFDESSQPRSLEAAHLDASPSSAPDAGDAGKDCDAAPPPVCGDGVCEDGEVCEKDCCDHACGDGVCSEGEDCPDDCDHDHCGDHVCQEGEQCESDCQPPGCDGMCGEDDTCPEDCNEEESGCTRTMGYWKTHNESAKKKPLRIDWPSPYDEDDLMCGRTLLSILGSPSHGDAWIILAHQYIAAALNVASGASTPASVDTALASAKSFLLANCGGIPASAAPQAIALAELLDSYNHGSAGPGHCH